MASDKPRRIRRVCGVEVPRVEDGRRSSAHKFRRLVKAYSAELGDLSEVDRGLVAQAAALAIHIERLQRDILEGRDVDADQVVRLSSEHRRLLTTLRSRAVKRKPTPPANLAELLAREENRA
jgi:hypothetical protein